MAAGKDSMTRILGLLCFALLLAMGGPLRAEEPALQAIGKGLVSHRATYGLSIARHDPRNYRSGIGGGLTLDDTWSDGARFVITLPNKQS